MRIGFIGLGRMGSNMVRRLLRDGHAIVAYNRSPEKTREIATEGAEAAFTIAYVVAALEKPRTVWIIGVGKSRSIFCRSRAMWTSITLVCGSK